MNAVTGKDVEVLAGGEMPMDGVEPPGNLIQASEDLGPALLVVRLALGCRDFGPIAVIRKEARTERAV
jgi:hypothetical protein